LDFYAGFALPLDVATDFANIARSCVASSTSLSIFPSGFKSNFAKPIPALSHFLKSDLQLMAEVHSSAPRASSYLHKGWFESPRRRYLDVWDYRLFDFQ